MKRRLTPELTQISLVRPMTLNSHLFGDGMIINKPQLGKFFNPDILTQKKSCKKAKPEKTNPGKNWTRKKLTVKNWTRKKLTVKKLDQEKTDREKLDPEKTDPEKTGPGKN